MTILGSVQSFTHSRGHVRLTLLERGRVVGWILPTTRPASFKYFETSPEITRLAVILYIRFPLFLRNVEDLLHERGIDVSHETVRYWWIRFGPMFASEIRRKRVQQLRAFSKWKWHVDEFFVKVNGQRHYLWRDVDHECEVLEAVVTKRRNKAAALKFLRKLMKRHGKAKPSLQIALLATRLRSENWDRSKNKRRAGGSTTALRIRTCRSNDANVPCNASGACEVYRKSPPSILLSITTSTRKDR